MIYSFLLKEVSKLSKIVLVSQSLRRGGAERVISNLSHELTRQGHQVYIILFQNEISYDYSGELICINSSPSKSSLKKMFEFMFRVVNLRLLFSKLQPNKIISFTESANFPTIMTLKSCVVSIRNNPNEKLNGWQKAFVRLLYRFPNVRNVVAVSKEIERSLNNDYGINNTVTIVNGINRSLIESKLRQKPSDFDLTENNYLLAVGRLDYQKGYEQLISSYSKSSFFGLIPLVILGNGRLYSELKQLCLSLGAEDFVIFKGSVDNPFYYMSNSRAYIMSSKFEGFPNSLLEAMSCGALCFSTDCPTGPSEMISHGCNGYLVESSNLGIDRIFTILERLEDGETLDIRLNAKKILDTHDNRIVCSLWSNL